MGSDDGVTIVVAVFETEQGASSMVSVRSVGRGELFYVLLPKADYSVLAFADSNGDNVAARCLPEAGRLRALCAQGI